MSLEFDEWQVAFRRTSPRRIYVELTMDCNYNCKHCFRQTCSEARGYMDAKLYEKIVEEASRASVEWLYLGGWGEPLLHPRIIEMVELAKEQGLKVAINTNGSMLPGLYEELLKAGIDRIIVSVDAVSEDTYSSVRGEALKPVIKALEDIAKARRRVPGSTRPETWFSYTLMRENVDELPKAFKLASSIGVTRILVSNLIPLTLEDLDRTCYANPELRRRAEEALAKASVASMDYHVAMETVYLDLRSERACPYMIERAACITWNGDVTPCYYYMHSFTHAGWSTRGGYVRRVGKVCFGSAWNGLLEAWNSIEYARFRFYTLTQWYPSCLDCPYVLDCPFAETNELDCWGRSPSCAACLFARNIVKCP